jgi:archaellin
MLRNFISAVARLVSWESLTRPGLARAAELGMVTGITGLVAVLATAATAATVTVAAGDLDVTALDQLVDTSISRVSGSLEIRGSVVARSEDGVSLSTIEIPVRSYGEGPAVSFAADEPERLTIAYYDKDVYYPDIPYTVEIVSGNGDDLLDPWETALIKIDFSEIGAQLQGNDRFTLELNAPFGGLITVDRRLPPILQPVMSLY